MRRDDSNPMAVIAYSALVIFLALVGVVVWWLL